MSNVHSMSTPRDNIDQLLAVSLIFAISTVAFIAAAMKYPFWDWFRVSLSICALLTAAAATVFFWVWKDVHNDGR